MRALASILTIELLVLAGCAEPHTEARRADGWPAVGRGERIEQTTIPVVGQKVSAEQMLGWMQEIATRGTDPETGRMILTPSQTPGTSGGESWLDVVVEERAPNLLVMRVVSAESTPCLVAITSAYRSRYTTVAREGGFDIEVESWRLVDVGEEELPSERAMLGSRLVMAAMMAPR